MKINIYLLTILLSINLISMEKQKRIQELIAKIKHEEQEQEQKSLRAEQRTLQFAKFVPKKKLDLPAIKRLFPQLFTGIPERYHQRVIDYAQNLYGDTMSTALEDINKRGAEAIREFKWEALGTIFNRAPFFGAGYVFIPDPRNKKNERSHFTHLPDFLASKDYSKAIEASLQKAQTEQEKNKLLNKLNDSQEKTKKVASTLAGNYKIHMMPKGSLTEILVKLLEALDKDPELNRLVGNFKLKVSAIYEKEDGKVLPLIAFYAAPGTDNAQKLLNKLYQLFKDTPGLNKQPRFNARVSDLLWIAQGDGDYKTDEFAKYYENPKRVYYRPDFTGKLQNYHLIHPETGKEIV